MGKGVDMKESVWKIGFPDEGNTELKTLLLIASGKAGNIELRDALCLGCYMGNGEWFLEDYPEIENATVSYWAETPELPERCKQCV